MRFLTEKQVREIANKYGTPTYVYSEAVLEEMVKTLLAFPNAFGLTVRFAMKACPNRAILQLIHRLGLRIDASSGFEVERAMAAGIPADHIQLTSQQLPANLFELVNKGMRFNACSLHQLMVYGEKFQGTLWKEISIRVNPGLGSGSSGKTNTGGPDASFGIWHEHLDTAKSIAKRYGLKITRLHTHIGSGSDPKVWVNVADMSLEIARQLPDVTALNLGGGQKVGRMDDEETMDLQVCGQAVKAAFERFAAETKRELHLEIEPGTYVVAAAGSIIAQVIDIVTTRPHENGRDIVKVDSGMTEDLRFSLYGAGHPLTVVPISPGETRGTREYVVVGHCCESGDILTPARSDPETVDTRELTRAEIGDWLVIDYAGAYCEGMEGAGYNTWPAAPSVLVRSDGTLQLIRKRQEPKDLWMNEIGLGG